MMPPGYLNITCGCVGKLKEKRGVEFTHLHIAAKSINKEVTKSNEGIG